jgi:hypothetical protein
MELVVTYFKVDQIFRRGAGIARGKARMKETTGTTKT